MRYSRLFGLFLIGFIFFNYPVITLFDFPQKIFKMPLLVWFLFITWFIIIGIAFYLVEISKGKRKEK
ncbi:MAG: hypothetical protein HQ517_15430 [SAR324 cluster bacterium]|nr:hypothetical protein [SAR324 cluster bacterium]